MGLWTSAVTTALVAALLVSAPASASTAQTTRVSVSSAGAQGNAASYGSISGDGRHVVFVSAASNLVDGDTNGVDDVFVHDRTSGTTTRVSVTSVGTEANGSSRDVSISDDGQYVAFLSSASNLVGDDTNERLDVFVHDRGTGATRRISTAPDGGESNGSSEFPQISGDGSSVAFVSYASNLVAGDTNLRGDVFVHGLSAGVTSRVSVASDGSQANDRSDWGPSISTDGSRVAFASKATNLGADTNDDYDVFVRDLRANTTTMVTVSSDGVQSDDDSVTPSISGNGQLVSFESRGTTLVPDDGNGMWDVFAHDLSDSTTMRVSVAPDGSEADSHSGRAVLTDDGTLVAFASSATNLVADDGNTTSDAFVRDLETESTRLVSVASDGTQGDGWSGGASLSGDGGHIGFTSVATNLVAGDTNGVVDMFVRGPDVSTPPCDGPHLTAERTSGHPSVARGSGPHTWTVDLALDVCDAVVGASAKGRSPNGVETTAATTDGAFATAKGKSPVLRWDIRDMAARDTAVATLTIQWNVGPKVKCGTHDITSPWEASADGTVLATTAPVSVTVTC